VCLSWCAFLVVPSPLGLTTMGYLQVSLLGVILQVALLVWNSGPLLILVLQLYDLPLAELSQVMCQFCPLCYVWGPFGLLIGVPVARFCAWLPPLRLVLCMFRCGACHLHFCALTSLCLS